MTGGFYEWNVAHERWSWSFVIFNPPVVTTFNRGWEDTFKKYRENTAELKKKTHHEPFHLNQHTSIAKKNKIYMYKIMTTVLSISIDHCFIWSNIIYRTILTRVWILGSCGKQQSDVGLPIWSLLATQPQIFEINNICMVLSYIRLWIRNRCIYISLILTQEIDICVLMKVQGLRLVKIVLYHKLCTNTCTSS